MLALRVHSTSALSPRSWKLVSLCPGTVELLDEALVGVVVFDCVMCGSGE